MERYIASHRKKRNASLNKRWATSITMKLTRHKVRLTLGLLTCGVGLFFILPADWIPFLSRGPIFYRFIDGAAWLLVGALLCLSPEFHLKLTHQIFVLSLG